MNRFMLRLNCYPATYFDSKKVSAGNSKNDFDTNYLGVPRRFEYSLFSNYLVAGNRLLAEVIPGDCVALVTLTLSLVRTA